MCPSHCKRPAIQSKGQAPPAPRLPPACDYAVLLTRADAAACSSPKHEAAVTQSWTKGKSHSLHMAATLDSSQCQPCH
jgi:hypothetical protein